MPSLISMKILGTAHHGIVNYRTIRYHNSAVGNSVWFNRNDALLSHTAVGIVT